MARSLFDPDKAAGGAAPQTANAQQLTVAQAVNLIKTTLETKLPPTLKIVGEVSNFKSSNHWYFSLKDAEAVLHCVAWATSVRKFGFTPKDGDQIVATGHISHFAPQGKTQLYVNDVQPVGAGALEQKFRALCNELRGLGYFDDARKKPLPVLPRRIAVITSATGAAIQDVINTAAHRSKAVGLLIVDVRVQGEGAAEEIASAIRWVDRNRQKLGVDAMLVTRGGGSIEDLWAFNERAVADAVFQCTLPVVAAIGHESDTTIIELVADLRASTPTQAAMRLVPSSQELCAQVEHLVHRIGALLATSLERDRQRLKRLAAEQMRTMKAYCVQRRHQIERLVGKVERVQPHNLIARQRADLRAQTARLTRSIIKRIDRKPLIAQLERQLHHAHRHVMSRKRELANAAERHLSAMDPHGVLRRGYSLTFDRSGTLIRSVDEVRHNQWIVTRLADGSIDSITETLSKNQPRRAAKQSNTPPDQLDLFGTGMA